MVKSPGIWIICRYSDIIDLAGLSKLIFFFKILIKTFNICWALILSLLFYYVLFHVQCGWTRMLEWRHCVNRGMMTVESGITLSKVTKTFFIAVHYCPSERKKPPNKAASSAQRGSNAKIVSIWKLPLCWVQWPTIATTWSRRPLPPRERL